jgi:ACS family sodium-dependent inorganic phosphate cotransporter
LVCSGPYRVAHPLETKHGEWSTRLTTALLLHVGLQVVYALRVLFSIAIIPISKQFGYDSVAQGYASSGFFAGYLFLQIPGGLIATKLGGHWVMFLGVLVPSLVTVITPFACASLTGLIACRVLTGLLEAVTYPATHALLSRWAPAAEKSQIVGLVWAGAYLGTALTLPAAGALVAGEGWASVFYVVGGLGVAWSAVWAVAGASAPEELSRISAEERDYIVANRGAAAAEQAVPWLRLASSAPVWGVCWQHFSHNWLFYMLLTEMPTYLTTVVGFDLQHSGAYAVLPYLGCFLGSIVFGYVADRLIKVGTAEAAARAATADPSSGEEDQGPDDAPGGPSAKAAMAALSAAAAKRVGRVRTWMGAVAELLPAACIAAAGNSSSAPVIIALLTAALGFSGASSASYASTYIDLAPRNAGVLLGIGNTLATCAGVLAPIVVGQLVSGKSDAADSWRSVFYIASAIAVLGFIFYAVTLRAAPLDFWSPEEDVEDGEEEEGARLVTMTVKQ